jgi:pilus assembly protein CpaB
VLAVGDSTLEKDTQERQVVNTVTLSVTPAQAEVLAFAYLSGWFHLSLRSPTDDHTVDLDYYSPDNLDSFRER